MSITLTSTALANNDLNEPQGGPSRSDFHEDDFESFLILPAETQTSISSVAIVSDQALSKAWSLSESMGPLAPSAEFTQKTAVLPGAPTAGEQNLSASLKTEFPNGPTMTIDAKAIGRGVAVGVLSETKGVVCFMPEKPIRPVGSVLQSGLDMAALAPVKTSEPAAGPPVFPKSADGISVEGTIVKSPSVDPDSIGNPSPQSQDVLNANRFKSLLLAVDAQPLRQIEIALKGGDDQRVDIAKHSPGLYPAGGFELTPPRIRVSFAEIADVLRSWNDRPALSTDVSERPSSDAPNYDAGDSSTAFSESGGNALLQTSGTSRIETAEAVGLSRSVRQIETEILQLASAASFRNENHSLRISLDSADLGSIEITLIRHEGGSMSAHLVTDSESSRQALNENLIQLRSSLENAGLQLQELEISCRSLSTGTQQGDRQDREGSHAAATRFHSAVTQESSGIPEVNGESHSRLLNLRA